MRRIVNSGRRGGDLKRPARSNLIPARLNEVSNEGTSSAATVCQAEYETTVEIVSEGRIEAAES